MPWLMKTDSAWFCVPKEWLPLPKVVTGFILIMYRKKWMYVQAAQMLPVRLW